MRAWFWTLLLAAVAVALAVVLQAHTGNVLILVPPHRIELSFTLAVLLIVGTFVVLYVGLRLLAWLLAIPSRMRDWRGRRAQARDHELLEKGWVGLLEGRFANAEKQFGKLIDQTKVDDRRAVAALSAARAAQELGEFSRRDALLEQARAAAGDDPGLSEAVATVSADMYLSQGRPADALNVLSPLQDGGARHLHTTRLLLRARNELGHHDQVFTLARALGRRHALAKPEAERLVDQSGAARLRAGTTNGDGWRVIWKELKSAERAYPEIALAAAQAFDAAGEPEEAGRVLETAINRAFSPALAAAYARCEAPQVKRRIEKAEVWLQQRPNDPDLLRVLGLLCLTGQLWGAAERYLLKSLRFRSDPQTHALLGSLYDRLNRPAEAASQWRMATAVGMALPTLAGDAALPSADTGHDPRYAGAEVANLDEIEPLHVGADLPETPGLSVASPAVAPVYAGTADALVVDAAPVAQPSQANAAAAVRPQSSLDGDFDEYFDSAPPPLEGLIDDTGRSDRSDANRDDTRTRDR